MTAHHSLCRPNRGLLLLVGFGLVWFLGTSALAAQTKRPKTGKHSQAGNVSRLSARNFAAARKQLFELGFWVSEKGGADETMRQAIIAFQKVTGRAATGRLTPEDQEALLASERPAPKETGPAHVEVDLTRQVLFFVNDEGVVEKILPVSSGNQREFSLNRIPRFAVTPTGSFTVSQKFPGWTKSPLGMMYYPSFFLGGIAIHGSPSVPTKPASHGCIRIPMFAAKAFSQMTPMGMKILVYERPQSPTTADAVRPAPPI